MPNYLINYEVTGQKDSVADALAELEDILEHYPSTMTLHAKDIMMLNRDRQKAVGWVMFDGQFARLIDDAYHLHEADNVILTEV